MRKTEEGRKIQQTYQHTSALELSESSVVPCIPITQDLSSYTTHTTHPDPLTDTPHLTKRIECIIT